MALIKLCLETEVSKCSISWIFSVFSHVLEYVSNGTLSEKKLDYLCNCKSEISNVYVKNLKFQNVPYFGFVPEWFIVVFRPWKSCITTRGGGTRKNFDRDARPIFLGLKLGKFFSYFSGVFKISAIFLGLTNFQLLFWVFQFLCHTLESFAWRTHSTEKHKIIVAFHIYSNFDKRCILSHSIFWGLNFGAFYFLGLN